MKIEFDKLDFVANAAFKGGDGAFEVKTSGDKDNKIMYGRLRKGCSIGMHRHEGTAEIIYVVSGEGVMSVEGGEEICARATSTIAPRGARIPSATTEKNRSNFSRWCPH